MFWLSKCSYACGVFFIIFNKKTTLLDDKPTEYFFPLAKFWWTDILGSCKQIPYTMNLWFVSLLILHLHV